MTCVGAWRKILPGLKMKSKWWEYSWHKWSRNEWAAETNGAARTTRETSHEILNVSGLLAFGACAKFPRVCAPGSLGYSTLIPFLSLLHPFIPTESTAKALTHNPFLKDMVYAVSRERKWRKEKTEREEKWEEKWKNREEIKNIETLIGEMKRKRKG